eukprot:15466687-Alexandrium_andersonii.AAC.1
MRSTHAAHCNPLAADSLRHNASTCSPMHHAARCSPIAAEARRQQKPTVSSATSPKNPSAV